MSRLRVAPGELLRGDGAIEALPQALRRAAHFAGPAGAPSHPLRALVVHGDHGYPLVRERVETAFAEADIALTRHHHIGPCSQRAIEATMAAAATAQASWIVAIGGGRVIDTAKGAAHASGRAFAALPTSPATCAATAPTVVLYDDAGRHLDALESGPASAVVAIDAGLLAGAPDRLLAAGVADAWAKVHEVTLTSRHAAPSATTRAALALVAELRSLLLEQALAALRAGPAGGTTPALRAARELVAEAVVVAPGLIGGLAGADAKVALAHPVHDALTALPGSHVALHGEKVAFGSLVQLELAGPGTHDADAAECVAARVAEAEHYAALGLRCDLASLGCADARGAAGATDLATRTLADPAVRHALPGLTIARLATAIEAVDVALQR